MSVAISKEGNDFTEVDIRKTEKPVASSKGIVGHVAANIQEEAVRRLNTLQVIILHPSNYGVISGLYFPVLGLNTGKYGPEITPYLDTLHAVCCQVKRSRI